MFNHFFFTKIVPFMR